MIKFESLEGEKYSEKITRVNSKAVKKNNKTAVNQSAQVGDVAMVEAAGGCGMGGTWGGWVGSAEILLKVNNLNNCIIEGCSSSSWRTSLPITNQK